MEVPVVDLLAETVLKKRKEEEKNTMLL